MMKRASQRGFTLVELIIVIVITGILGAIVAIFIKSPVQGYVDSSRRAEMTDIADTALRRISRDLRLALPNSVRVNAAGAVYHLDFLVTSGGGRYRTGAGGTNNILDFSGNDNSFEVLGAAPACLANDQVVVYNLGIAGAEAYTGDNRTLCSSVAPPIVNITPKKFPFESPGARFHIVREQVRYICDPGARTLTRYSLNGGAIVAPAAMVPAGASSALLASRVSGCDIKYDPFVVAQRTGLVSMQLTLSESGESVTLYSATHVGNEP